VHKRLVFNITSRILLIVCFCMLAPLGWAVHDNPRSLEVMAFVVTILAGLLISLAVRGACRIQAQDFKRINSKDTLAIVGLSWIVAAKVLAARSALSRERLNKASVWPAVVRWRAMGAPITPVPINAIFAMSASLAKPSRRRQRCDQCGRTSRFRAETLTFDPCLSRSESSFRYRAGQCGHTALFRSKWGLREGSSGA